MTRRWKAGDVASYDGLRVFLVANRTHGLMWVDQEGDERPIPVDAIDERLVVIDPEDEEQVSRLRVAYYAALRAHPDQGSKTLNQDAFRAALRSLVAPPKPDEPKGLGAVVEDEQGHRWSRARSHSHGNNWREEFGGRWRRWDEFPSVRVLSEGVA